MVLPTVTVLLPATLAAAIPQAVHTWCHRARPEWLFDEPMRRAVLRCSCTRGEHLGAPPSESVDLKRLRFAGAARLRNGTVP